MEEAGRAVRPPLRPCHPSHALRGLLRRGAGSAPVAKRADVDEALLQNSPPNTQPQPYHAEHSGAAAVPSLSSALFRVVLRASRSALPLPRARTRRCRRWAGTLRAHRCRTNSGSPALRLRLL